MRVAVSIFGFLISLGILWADAKSPTDAEIRKAIIRMSLTNYSGNCPCPYNVDRAGRSCGRRSAYTKPGGASPICYEEDVTKEMIEAFRSRQKSKSPI